MTLNLNQGSRPAYQSSILPLQYKKACEHVEHKVLLGTALADLSKVTELDFEQARALWSKVLNDEDRARLIRNVAGHLASARTAEVKARMPAIFAAVDQGLADRIAGPTKQPAQSTFEHAFTGSPWPALSTETPCREY